MEMRRESAGAFLSAVFVDYDNIYLSLKRKSEEAAKRFAKDAHLWLREIESGRLITPTNSPSADIKRRIVMNRCYGNPVPRRNAQDNSTDMNSFPFIRHHFLRSGFEIVDCPPLTAQLKNSSDIRMVMDVRDYLTHDTYFDEFVILSGDADFTPVLHRLRAHARRTIIYANDYTAAPYTAISDGEIREADLLTLLTEGRLPGEAVPVSEEARPAIPSQAQIDIVRKEIIAEVVAGVRAATGPVPLEALADRAVRQLGHDKTIGTSWGGAGGFRDLLLQQLPPDIRLSEQPPYFVIDTRRQAPAEAAAPAAAAPSHATPAKIAPPIPTQQPMPQAVGPAPAPMAPSPALSTLVPQRRPMPPAPGTAVNAPMPPQGRPLAAQDAPAPGRAGPPPGANAPGFPALGQGPAAGRESRAIGTATVARIHEACQAPPLAPNEYRVLFELMAQEISANGLTGTQTIANIARRAQEYGLELRRDDVRFVLEVVSESDPWFEQGASANLFAGRFRNFVVARCRGQGLNLSADELDLIERWFTGSGGPMPAASAQPMHAGAVAGPSQPGSPPGRQQQMPIQHQATPGELRADRWWPQEDGAQRQLEPADMRADSGRLPPGENSNSDDFPRIVRTRLRG